MPKTTRSNSGHNGGRTKAALDLRALLILPQDDLQSQLSVRLQRLGFPAMRQTHVQLLNAISGLSTAASGSAEADRGVRLADLIGMLSLPKQTVGDLLDELEQLKMVERFPDPDHGVIKRVRLGPKGKVWAAEVKRVSAATEAKWATRLGSKKMKSLRALLEELAATVHDVPRKQGAPSASRVGSPRSEK
jgi:DNA-binding MarR family transcriptional regulator